MKNCTGFVHEDPRREREIASDLYMSKEEKTAPDLYMRRE
jgi:hypothetical protein